jgi:4-diphosphocytidyl-2-C-methyl-D-erythritol kinase
MDLRGEDCKRIARAPAKLNLFLDVLGRCSDGFHDLETLMVPVRLADQVTFTPTTASISGQRHPIELVVRDCLSGTVAARSVVPQGSENLIVKGLELLRARSGCRMGARLELTKRIPMGAGLGGGSSDAASALRLANCAWHLNWPSSELLPIAAELGSDIPFFLAHGAAICRGRGERIESVPPLPRLHFVIVKPDESLSTGSVFTAHDSLASENNSKLPGQLNRLLASLQTRSWPDVGRWMHNRLQAAACVLSSWVETLRQAFARLDFVGHQLTGSGSAYFGVCRHAQSARRLANILRTQQLGTVYTTCSC